MTAGIMYELTNEGDTRHMWDSANADETAAARSLFDDMKGKGYLAYRAQGKKGEAGEQLRRFDPEAGRIVFVKPLAGG